MKVKLHVLSFLKIKHDLHFVYIVKYFKSGGVETNPICILFIWLYMYSEQKKPDIFTIEFD